MGFFDDLQRRKKELSSKLEKHRAERDFSEFNATQERIKKLKSQAVVEQSRVLRQQRQTKARSQEAKLKQQIHDAKAIQHEARNEKIKAFTSGLNKLLSDKPKPRRRKAKRKVAKRKAPKRKVTRRKPARRKKRR